MTIGKVIKRLRKERFLSQEELAEQLNISPQAISKWETDVSLPDISQVVPIAHFFGVSTDVLFDVDGENYDEEIANAHERYLKHKRYNFELIYNELIEILKKYPSNHVLLLDYLHICETMLEDINREKRDEIFAEAERCSSVLLAQNHNFTVMRETYSTMAQIYIMMEKFDKAEEYIKFLSPIWSDTQGALLAQFYMATCENEKREHQLKENIRDLLDGLLYNIIYLGNTKRYGEPDNIGAIKIYKKVEEITHAVFGNDYAAPVSYQVCQSIGKICTCYVELQDVDNAIKYLKLLCDFVIDANNRDSYNEKTLLFNEFEHLDYVGIDTDEKAPLSKRFIQWVDNKFNEKSDVSALLCNDPRYKQIKEDFYNSI